jgi:hypothetical protein
MKRPNASKAAARFLDGVLIADEKARKLQAFGKSELSGAVRPPFPKHWDWEREFSG